MSALNPTPPGRLVDAQGRPYFLWDEELSLEGFRDLLNDAAPEVREYYLGKLLRQAKPDDVFTFVRPQQIADSWARVERYLGATRPFWSWLMGVWERQGSVHRPSH